MDKIEFVALVEQGKGKAVDLHSIHIPSIDWNHEVPVRINFEGEKIGTTKLSVQGGKVIGNMKVSIAELNKAGIDIKQSVCWPAVGLSHCEYDKDGKIISAKITEVSICGDRNCDATIPSINFDKKQITHADLSN